MLTSVYVLARQLVVSISQQSPSPYVSGVDISTS